MSDFFHYQSCGLDNVWLRNGFESQQTPYGEATAIADVKGLHKTIGLFITDNEPLLSGVEIRFLRKELDLSQTMLAEVVGVSEPTIRNWETGRQPVTAPADRFIRLLYREHVDGNAYVRAMVDRLAKLDHARHIQRLELESTGQGWKAAA
ncbi:MAG: helix-turn-helix domain-containing protein [Thiothrix sp.]|jgi:DNA-binding transcriptional regulator YiaG|uniref:helix-turn-helix domain-containing protein n=1 Tax=Thiothrix sp. TaxID=1032 RepID=UPI0026239843|nr:helix-turn-helix domain-containing protein [Thiothrix sp.]MDD5394390.1 helix-turn-helix domain-containing protein [Thiothrix sp.]